VLRHGSILPRSGASGKPGAVQGRAARPRAIRHHHDALRRGVLRLAGRWLHRPDRSGERRRERHRAADPAPGARRIWPDAQGALWVSEFHAGQLARFQPAENAWQSWCLPGTHPQPYAIYVDEHDFVWVSDFGVGALLRFDPASGRFDRVAGQAGDVWVRQLLGRPGEVWGADSAHDRLIRVSERG
jgi:virginiamycin B lyase